MSTPTEREREARAALRQAKLVVVKVGTAVLTGSEGSLDEEFIGALASQLARARQDGRSIVLVSSGAVSAGLGALGLAERPSDLTLLQASAAAGQSVLMSMWREALGREGHSVSQLLLTRSDFDSRERFLNIRNCAHALLERGVLPIVNENDTVATEEISLGDNDVLAAKLGMCVGAEALVMLTSEDGVQDDAGAPVSFAPDASDLKAHVREGQTGAGRGGMQTKLEAARIAQIAGMPCVIGAGRPAETLGEILGGSSVGTLVGAIDGPSHRGRRQWIALTATPLGIIEVDDGAAQAVALRQASLLAKGVVGCQGRFEVGDVVVVRDQKGREIGRGLTNLSTAELHRVMGRDSRELAAILGRPAHEEVIHRDNLALTSGANREPES